MSSIIQEAGETFVTLVKGFSVTFRNMLRKPVTENYPEEPVHFQPRYRGIHVLQRDENGLEKCVGCFLCAAACPARCIYIEAAENTDANRISAGERYARVYNIDYSRCIFCGYCVEACPTDAITHGHDFELATSNINAMIYRKEKLLEKSSRRTLGFAFFPLAFLKPQGQNVNIVFGCDGKCPAQGYRDPALSPIRGRVSRSLNTSSSMQNKPCPLKEWILRFKSASPDSEIRLPTPAIEGIHSLYNGDV